VIVWFHLQPQRTLDRRATHLIGGALLVMVGKTIRELQVVGWLPISTLAR
jgi:hypothetical protein